MKKIVIVLLSLLMFLSGCGASNKKVNEQENNKTENNSEVKGKSQLTVWSTYWDLDTVDEELSSLKNNINELCYFEAYYDEQGKLTYPDKLKEYAVTHMDTLKAQGVIQYISIVNDMVKEDGTSVQKDTELLYKLFSTEDTMKKCADDIISLARDNGYNGIEMDYEKIRNDLALWEKYSKFLEILNKEAEENNFKVRVILEPSTPAEKISLPKGPAYIMMCYNLYGYGTEPGPKADKNFITEMTELMKKVSDNRGFALATGGFDFSEDNKVVSVTEKIALATKTENNAEVKRDPDSRALYFDYKDAEGVSHTVWYADGETLKYWMDILESKGETNISLWRLGGNETLSKIID